MCSKINFLNKEFAKASLSSFSIHGLFNSNLLAGVLNRFLTYRGIDVIIAPILNWFASATTMISNER